MDTYNLANMVRGWFVGAFEPTVLHTNAVEVGVKTYSAGFSEDAHFHKVATEITVVISGEAIMGDRKLVSGDIAVIHPNEATSFKALTDVTTVVVKVPGASNDKYLVS